MKIMPGPERDGTLKGCAVLAIPKRKWAYVKVDFGELGPVKPMLALFDILLLTSTPHLYSGQCSRCLPADQVIIRVCLNLPLEVIGDNAILKLMQEGNTNGGPNMERSLAHWMRVEKRGFASGRETQSYVQQSLIS